MVYAKTGIFIIQQLFEALIDNRAEIAARALAMLDDWLAQEENRNFHPELREKVQALAAGSLDMRALAALWEPLAAAQDALFADLQLRLYTGEGLPPATLYPPGEGVIMTAIRNKPARIRLTGEGSIHLALLAVEEDLSAIQDRIDASMTMKELALLFNYCHPIDVFVYDRFFLQAKLESLKTTRRNTRIALIGTSYAMVGLLEERMPAPATTFAINGQDPYYTFLTLRRALQDAPEIDRVVLLGSYYFWHMDISEKPSDYSWNVLSKVQYPIHGDKHNYEGEIPPLQWESKRIPFLHHFFAMDKMREQRSADFRKRIEGGAYYNATSSRPEHGMLSFDFHTAEDAINDKTAAIRVKGHNGAYNLERLRRNSALFRDFVEELRERGIALMLIVPPVTGYYRRHADPRLRESFYEEFKPEAGAYAFYDLFESPEYLDEDFRDFDHLDTAGAEKLSAFVAERLRSIES